MRNINHPVRHCKYRTWWKIDYLNEALDNEVNSCQYDKCYEAPFNNEQLLGNTHQRFCRVIESSPRPPSTKPAGKTVGQ